MLFGHKERPGSFPSKVARKGNMGIVGDSFGDERTYALRICLVFGLEVVVAVYHS